jgi:hypothetical protein
MGGGAFDTYDSMLGFTRKEDLPGYTIFGEDKNSGGEYIYHCYTGRFNNRPTYGKCDELVRDFISQVEGYGIGCNNSMWRNVVL